MDASDVVFVKVELLKETASGSTVVELPTPRLLQSIAHNIKNPHAMENYTSVDPKY